MWAFNSFTPTINTFTLDAATDQMSVVFQAEKSDTITHVGFLQGTVTGTPGTLRVGLQGVVTTTGLEGGTWLGSGSGYADHSPVTGNNGIWVVLALGASVSVTAGETYALVLDPQAVGTWDASNKVTVCSVVGSDGGQASTPYHIENGVIFNNTDNGRRYLLRSSTRTYAINPWSDIASYTFHSGTTPDEDGLRFKLPTSFGSTIDLIGVKWHINIPRGATETETFDIILYDTDGTTSLTSKTEYAAQKYRYTTVDSHYMFLSSPYTLSTNKEYTLVLRPNQNTLSYTMPYANYGGLAAGDLPLYGDGGDIKRAARTNAGSWTEYTTQLPMVQLIMRTVASGGLITHPGTSGGMRG